MFIMDVPAVPPQQTPIVLAQSATPEAGVTLQPDFILKECQETTSTGDPRSAMRAVDPAYMLHNLYNIELSAIKITLLKDTTHGKITAGVDNTGRTSYHYDAEPSYVGNDQAVFMAEYQGKHIKIVLDFHVFMGVTPGDQAPYVSTCSPAKLIKVTKPSSGFNGHDINSLIVNFDTLPGAAVGQTTGSNITIDTNAAGNGWYIDTTPWNNSVLLHEYSHALGIAHSADPKD